MEIHILHEGRVARGDAERKYYKCQGCDRERRSKESTEMPASPRNWVSSLAKRGLWRMQPSFGCITSGELIKWWVISKPGHIPFTWKEHCKAASVSVSVKYRLSHHLIGHSFIEPGTKLSAETDPCLQEIHCRSQTVIHYCKSTWIWEQNQQN